MPDSRAIFLASGEMKTRAPLESTVSSLSMVAVDAGALGALETAFTTALAAGAAEAPPPDLIAAASSPLPASTRMTVPTGTVCPSATPRRATVPSSNDWSSMVALSVSMSAMTSPLLIAWPSLTFHLTMVPCCMVSDRRGMEISIGMEILEAQFGCRRSDRPADTTRATF